MEEAKAALVALQAVKLIEVGPGGVNSARLTYVPGGSDGWRDFEPKGGETYDEAMARAQATIDAALAAAKLERAP